MRLAPSRRCASGMVSRKRHSAARSRSLRAMAASSTSAAATARRRAPPSSSVSSDSCGGGEESSHSTYHGVGLLERIGDPRHVPHGELHARCAASARRRSLDRRCAAQSRQQIDRRTARPAPPTSAVAMRRMLREQLEARGGDDAERAFGAEEQGLDVVAGVVLAQALERCRARGRRPAPPPAPAPGRASCRSAARGAAGVGREVAADLAAAFGAQAQREEALGVAPRPAAPPPACSRPRRSVRIVVRHRRCGCDSGGGARARSGIRIHPASRRRSSWCCRPAAPPRRAPRRTGRAPGRLQRPSAAAPPPARARDRAGGGH